MRTSPTFLSFIDPQAWKDIYGHRTASYNTNAKDWRFYSRPQKSGEYNINNIPADEHHGKVRRIFANAFFDRTLKLQEPLICRHVDKLVRNIHRLTFEEPAANIDMVQMYSFMAFDVMSDLTFGQATGMLDNGEISPWLKIVYGYVKATNLMVVIRFIIVFRPFTGFVISRQDIDARNEHFKNSTRILDERLRRGRDEPDIWNLVETKNEGLLTHGQVHANAAVFMSAGTETIATQLCGITYLLLSHPRQLERLLCEIRSFPHREDLSLEQLRQLPYLNACLKEGLRLYPPVAEGLPRRIARDSAPVLGYHLAPDTTVYVSPYAANRSLVNFEDPNLFRPERWLLMSRYDSDHRSALQFFSTGPRNCLGKKCAKSVSKISYFDFDKLDSLAYHEMRLALARVLYSFDLTLKDPDKDWIGGQKTYVFWEKGPLSVRASVALSSTKIG